MTNILRVRSRDSTQAFLQPIGNRYYRNARNGFVLQDPFPVKATYAGMTVEKCFDENHGHKKTYREGGPFFLVKVTQPTGICASGHIFPTFVTSRPAGLPYPYRDDPSDLWQAGYMGNFTHVNLPSLLAIPNQNISGPDDYRAQINANDLTSLGARAYNKLRPKVEVAGLGQAIAEARDVPATLRKSAKGFAQGWDVLTHNTVNFSGISGRGKLKRGLRIMQPKNLADHFINHQFGWRPFIKDLSQMYDLIVRYDEHLTKAEQLNDKWLKRHFAEEEVLEETVVYDQTLKSTSPVFTAYLNPLEGGLGQLDSTNMTVKRQKMTRVWYEGLFKTYYPELDKRIPMQENIRAGREFLRLAGAYVDPVLIYKTTPWTWCIDWFTNVGDNVQLAQDLVTDSVASRYMYLMRETYDRYEYVSTHIFKSGLTINGVSYQEVRVKRRVSSASPFGFSLSPASLSPTQYAILVALGISKG